MNELITNINLKFACPASWDEMSNAAGCKHCDACNKKVYDLTNCDRPQLDKLLAENNYSICGRFTAQQLAYPASGSFWWRKWLSAAMVFIGFGLLDNVARAQNVPVKTKTDTKTMQEPILLGEVVVVTSDPVFVGGTKALNHFIDKNIRYQNKAGKVVVSFVVDRNGTISEPHIQRGLNEACDIEALRLVNLMPKWVPARMHGQPIERVCSLTINFDKRNNWRY